MSKRRLKFFFVFLVITTCLHFSIYAVNEKDENKNYRISLDDLNSNTITSLYDVDNTIIPRKFNLTSKMKIPVANQKNLGLCETFASLKSIETNYALKSGTYIDLSERYLDYMMSTDFYSVWRKTGVLAFGNTNGKIGDGSLSSEVLTFAESFGVPTEKDVPYRNYTEEEYPLLASAKPALITTSTILFPDFSDESSTNKNSWTNIIKAHVMKYGSVDARISAPNSSTNYNESTHSYYDFRTLGTGDEEHAISIVGWDDDYSKSNFKNQPGKNGAFICLNSWGEEWGDSGYFYISYSDANIYSHLIGVLDTELPNEYNVHTFDSKLFSHKGFMSKNASTFGIKYKKEKENEYITHITAGIGGYKEGVYTAKVRYYINPYDDSFDRDKMVYLGETNSVTNGFLSNITLDEPIRIEGDTFSVMFEIVGNLEDIFLTYSQNGDGSMVSGNMYCYVDEDHEWLKIDVEFPVYLFTVTKNGTIERGDVNKDYFVNSTDAAIVLDKYSSTDELTKEDYDDCDLNNDNTINSTDAALILDIYKKK